MTGKNVDMAVQAALKELNVSREQVDVEILETSGKKYLGIFGDKPAKVRVTVVREAKVAPIVPKVNVVKEKKIEPDDLKELYTKLQEENDDLVDNLRFAYDRGYESGTYSEIDDDFWSTIEGWDGDGFTLISPDDGYKMDSEWKLEIDPAYFFKEIKPEGDIYYSLIDAGTWTQDQGIYLQSPRYGWSGFDQDAAIDYLKDESDLSEYIKPVAKEKKQA
jgi:predicted RNA-binding protein Jag